MATTVLSRQAFLVPRLEKSRVENRPERNEPAKKDKPEQGREDKLNDGDEQTPLKQLTESRHKKTAERRDDITG